MNYNEAAVERHAGWRGKIEVVSRVALETKEDLSVAYTPGVAEPCRRIHKNRDDVFRYTRRWNLVAVVTDGSAVLGLGNIGAEAAMPVMEGKAVLFKTFGDVDAFPVCLATQETEEIVTVVKAIAPTFGGINLEDISAPRCFEIEERLIEALDIPVFHDDQHGTAVVVLGALINALKITGRGFEEVRVVINGCGAAGVAVMKLLRELGTRQVVMLDSKGIVCAGRKDLNAAKRAIVAETNPEGLRGGLEEAMRGADVFIGVSVKDVVTAAMVRSMAKDAVVLALANPDPEIVPEAAKGAGARIVGTGRSDYANQVNNVLGFPGIFRGALDVRARRIDTGMKIAAARALAGCVGPEELREEYILPSPLDRGVARRVAEAVAAAARESGAARQ